MSRKKKYAPPENTVRASSDGVLHPFAMLSRAIVADTTVNPPDYGDSDLTREDRERHKDRIRDQIKPKLPEIIGGNPIFGDRGKIKVPVKGGYEPRWRHGRDGNGGGGNGPEGGDQ